MEKSPEAFRTIREVAEGMDLPQHVLRFWETRFPQIKPLKRAGGRRYYRPDDVERLRVIKRLLYEEGYTIKGVQKLFRQQGAQALVQNNLFERASTVAQAARQEEAESGALVTAAEPIESAPQTEAAADFAAQPEDAPPVAPAGPVLTAQDMEALRASLIELREAARILAQVRAQER